MPAARNDPNQNSDSEMRMVALAVVVVIVIALLWYVGRGYIVRAGFGFAYAKLWVAQHVVGLGERGQGALQYIADVFAGRTDAWKVNFTIFHFVMDGAGEKVKYAYVAAVAGMAAWCLLKMRGNMYSSSYSMDSFIAMQQRYWGTLAVSHAFKPDTAPPTWDQARRPTDWVKDNSIPMDPHGGIDAEACKAVFEGHLGDVWRGLSPDLPVHVQALFVIFGLHHVQHSHQVGKEKTNASLHLRNEISRAWAALGGPGKAFDARVAELIKPFVDVHGMNKAIEKYADPKKHAYVNTALVRMLWESRKRRGVLPTAEILWVKGIDRTLYYVLNNVGRRAYHVEGGGAIAHFDAERITGQALVEPHVAEAVEGVKRYLEEHHIKDVELFLKNEQPEKWEQ